MSHSHILTSKIPQLVFVGAHWLTGREVVCDVREVEKEGERVDKDHGADERGGNMGFEQMRGDYRAVGMRDENKSAPAVVFDDCLDFTDYDILLERWVRYTRAHGHNLECDYADSCITSTKLPCLV
jgi:hypothetical protein